MAEKSKLAEILGVEEDEEFTIKITCSTYRVHDGRLESIDDHKLWLLATNDTICRLINDPSLIIRKPRLTSEEMAVLRWLHKHGKLKRFCKTLDGRIGATVDGFYGLGGNIADYLLRPGEEIDLDKMFKEDEDG